ncbi:MAG: GNAT family N-acetyltransferase [Deltaproteobacteria bacterium]|uniref:GNAT family N-acetyltransferase n=1 Tax=Candidatus Zymogenus saltonus TaxID=2844893 RepID=A0A9D8PM71_9DELT|nr:GNAT family N-acetyltransferase [Candidatus Zymogenus saltonus]
MDFSIRKANPGDEGGIAILVSEFRRLAYGGEKPMDEAVKTVKKQLENCFSDESRLLLVAVDKTGEVVGYSAVHWLSYLVFGGTEGYVAELYVREDLRDRGVGGRLLDEVVAEAKSRGCVRLMLVNKQKRESYKRGFYKKQGWVEREDAANFVYPL